MAAILFSPRLSLLGVFAAVCTAVTPSAALAELLIGESPPVPEYYPHPVLRSLVFVTPESRAQAILPPAPYFVAPAPLIWRAPNPIYPPPGPIGFNRSGAPSNRDVATYSVTRAHLFSQNLYRQGNRGLTFWYGPSGSTYWLWSLADPLFYPPPAPGMSHPSNRDNAAYLIERAHRFSQNGYRKP